jgi:DNA polymerase III delta subunit
VYEKIDSQIIEQIIIPELEESIFVFIDDVLEGNKKKSIQGMRTILEQSETIPFYYGLVSNIRLAFYINLHIKM